MQVVVLRLDVFLFESGTLNPVLKQCGLLVSDDALSTGQLLLLVQESPSASVTAGPAVGVLRARLAIPAESTAGDPSPRSISPSEAAAPKASVDDSFCVILSRQPWIEHCSDVQHRSGLRNIFLILVLLEYTATGRPSSLIDPVQSVASYRFREVRLRINRLETPVSIAAGARARGRRMPCC
jgi:hypothetical protein